MLKVAPGPIRQDSDVVPEVVCQVSSKVGFARRDREGLLIFKVLQGMKESLEAARGTNNS